MKYLNVCAALLGLGLSTAPLAAETIGVLRPSTDDAFQNILFNSLSDYAATLGAELVVEVSDRSQEKQIEQLKSVAAMGVSAIIVIPVEASGNQPLSDAADAAGVPLVFVNQGPLDTSIMADRQTYVGSDENQSGTMQTEEVCALLKVAGKDAGAKVAVLNGELTHFAANLRTKDIHTVVATPECAFMQVVAEAEALWNRDKAEAQVAAWLAEGLQFDAVIANNDEMALGTIAAYKAAGQSLEDVIVAGIDATADALQAMTSGDLDVTVFQNAAAQGEGAVEAAMALAAGKDLPRFVDIQFELVTNENVGFYIGMN